VLIGHPLDGASAAAASPTVVPSFLPTDAPPDDKVADPAVIADRIVAVLKQTRTIAGQPRGKVEPVGVRVSVNMEVIGLRGQPLLLSWTVLQRSGNVPLPKEWRANNAGYVLQATSEHDTGNVDFWVPLPKAPGLYYISLTLTTKNGIRLTSVESQDFG
jgi:hypothetical protein